MEKEKSLNRLAQITQRQLALGLASGPIDQEEVVALSREALSLASSLFPLQGETVEEEANLCLTLLMAYTLSLYGPADRLSRLDALSRRAASVLSRLAPSALKVRLLAWSYAGVEDERLLSEANEIIAGWDRQRLTEEQALALREMETFFVLD